MSSVTVIVAVSTNTFATMHTVDFQKLVWMELTINIFFIEACFV